MPYFVSNQNPDCSGWAVEKEDGEVMGCHRTRQEAIDQMVALSLAEDIEPGGERAAKQMQDDRRPPQGAREEAERGLEWRREYNRGGTAVGVARARDIANGENLSEDTVRRMVSYFARHEVDKQGEGWSPDQDGYPSAGRIAWALWGGDPGRTWAEALVRRADRAEERSEQRETVKARRTRPRVKLQQKSAAATFQVKAAATDAPNGEVTALVSVFGNEDLVGDRVMKGAFAKSLAAIKEAGRSIPFVWSHQWADPNAYIGKVLDAEETDDGLLVRASLFDTQTAQHIKTLLKEGVVTEFSFAYDVIKQRPGKDGVNELTEVHILEAGPTLKGANPATQLVNVRSALGQKAEPGELDLGDFVTWEGGYGRVEYVMTEGEFGVEGDPLSLAATADDPLAMVRIYEQDENGAEPTDLFTGFRFSELTAAEAPAEVVAEEEVEAEAAAATTGAKAGRVLSSKNEGRIREAVGLLDEVLGTLGDAGEKAAKPGSTDEAEEVAEAAATGVDPVAVLALLELDELA